MHRASIQVFIIESPDMPVGKLSVVEEPPKALGEKYVAWHRARDCSYLPGWKTSYVKGMWVEYIEESYWGHGGIISSGLNAVVDFPNASWKARSEMFKLFHGGLNVYQNKASKHINNKNIQHKQGKI